jgi:hypothetical protein
MKKIKFLSSSEVIGITGYSPTPALRSLPLWYKNLKRFFDNPPKLDGVQMPQTVKACPPFLDALGVGYTIYLEYDLHVTANGEDVNWKHKIAIPLLDSHSAKQAPPEMIPLGYSKTPLKFLNYWQIKTKRGYSSLFTHPINRNDLPFITISGLVETDRYQDLINLPFLIQEGFQGVIPMGTPIAQVIPIKRESWVIELGKANSQELKRASAISNSAFMGVYKKLFWVRKDYK